jgi:ADP-ribose pyrophosphatase
MPRPDPAILARREVSSNRFLTYVEEDVQGTDGKPHPYYFVESKWDAVIAVPILDDGRLVIERIYRHPYRKWFLEFPAGGIERGEDPRATAARELEEETGWRPRSTTVLGSYEAMPGLVRMRLHVVLAEGLVHTGRTVADPMEMIDVLTMGFEEAWKQMETGESSSFLTVGLLYLRAHRSPPGK